MGIATRSISDYASSPFMMPVSREMSDEPYVKSQFPSAHISADLQPAVHPAGDEDSDYSVFDEKTVEDLKKKSAREVEVELADKRLNLNAPEDIIS